MHDDIGGSHDQTSRCPLCGLKSENLQFCTLKPDILFQYPSLVNQPKFEAHHTRTKIFASHIQGKLIKWRRWKKTCSQKIVWCLLTRLAGWLGLGGQYSIVGLYGDLSWARVNMSTWWIGVGTGICGYMIIWHMHGFKSLSNSFVSR